MSDLSQAGNDEAGGLDPDQVIILQSDFRYKMTTLQLFSALVKPVHVHPAHGPSTGTLLLLFILFYFILFHSFCFILPEIFK